MVIISTWFEKQRFHRLALGNYFVFFFKIYSLKKHSDRKRKISSIHWFTPQIPTMARAGQRPRNSNQISHMGPWIWAIIHCFFRYNNRDLYSNWHSTMRCWHLKWLRFKPLYHNIVPILYFIDVPTPSSQAQFLSLVFKFHSTPNLINNNGYFQSISQCHLLWMLYLIYLSNNCELQTIVITPLAQLKRPRPTDTYDLGMNRIALKEEER